MRVLALAVASAAALAACRPPAPPASGGSGGTPRAAPTAPHADLLDAATDLDGQLIGRLAPTQRATVAIVFASWCGHCRDEIRVLEVLRANHPEVRFLGVNYIAHEEYDGRGDAIAVRDFVDQRAPWLRVVPADEGLWSGLGRPPKVPTIFVFDRSGALAKSYDRRVDPLPSFDDLDAVVTALR